MSGPISEERLKVIAHRPKAFADDLPSLGEAVDMAIELLLLREVRAALERFVRAEKAWMDAKAPMELRAPGTFEDPLSDAYSHAVLTLAKLPRCCNLGPRIPMVQHERPTCELSPGHDGDHGAQVHGGRLLSWTNAAPQNRGSILNKADLCSDCPPDGWPTDKTRCSDCPRSLASKAAP